MRKIPGASIAIFCSLLSAILMLTVGGGWALFRGLPPGDFRGVVTIVGAIAFGYLLVIGCFRMFLVLRPLREGPIAEASAEEIDYHVYLLFQLTLIHPLTRSLLLPVPLMRLLYLALGTKLGDNSYSAGTLLDPPLTEVGDNSIIGHDAVLFCHAVEGRKLSLARILIGSNVTIGAKAVIMPGVTVGDGAIVAVGAVVPKGTTVGPGELWMGVPARRVNNPADSAPSD